MGETEKAIRAAAHAHTNLNTFAAVVTLLEGGHLYSGDLPAVPHIIRICKREQAIQLRLYDAAVARALKAPTHE